MEEVWKWILIKGSPGSKKSIDTHSNDTLSIACKKAFKNIISRRTLIREANRGKKKLQLVIFMQLMVLRSKAAAVLDWKKHATCSSMWCCACVLLSELYANGDSFENHFIFKVGGCVVSFREPHLAPQWTCLQTFYVYIEFNCIKYTLECSTIKNCTEYFSFNVDVSKLLLLLQLLSFTHKITHKNRFSRTF